MHVGLGLGLGLTQSGGGAAVFDPTTLTLSGWWKPDFTAVPWVGAAGGNLSSAIPPTSGTTVNGHAPATFNGTNQSLNSASAISSFISSTTAGIALLVKSAASGADPGAGLRNGARTILSDSIASGYFGVGITTTGPVAYVFDGAYNDVKASTSDPTGAWHVVFVKLTGGVLSVALDGGAYTDKTLTGDGAIDVVTGALTLGSGFGGLFYSGDVLEVMTRSAVWTAQNKTDIYSYFQATYPGASLP